MNGFLPSEPPSVGAARFLRPQHMGAKCFIPTGSPSLPDFRAYKIERAPATPEPSRNIDFLGTELYSIDVLGLQTLGSLLHLELHLRAFIQGAISIGLDRRKMNEHVIAAGTLDESISFCGIKPFHYAFFFDYLFSCSLFVF